MFYCDTSVNLFCILWNLISIPVRAVLILLIGSLMFTCFLFLFVTTFFSWIIGALCAAIFVGPCIIAADQECPKSFLIILLYPFVVIIAFVVVLKELSPTITSTFLLFEESCDVFAEIWVGCSPKECCDDF